MSYYLLSMFCVHRMFICIHYIWRCLDCYWFGCWSGITTNSILYISLCNKIPFYMGFSIMTTSMSSGNLIMHDAEVHYTYTLTIIPCRSFGHCAPYTQGKVNDPPLDHHYVSALSLLPYWWGERKVAIYPVTVYEYIQFEFRLYCGEWGIRYTRVCNRYSLT